MNIDELETLWVDDCQIDVLDLGAASYNTPKLHSKYYPIYTQAKRRLFKLRAAYKKLKAEKVEFLNNPNEEHKQEGWEYPDRLILKNEIPTFIDSDNQLIKVELSIGEQELLVDFLQDILKQISVRNWIIKNIQDDRKFMAGEF